MDLIVSKIASPFKLTGSTADPTNVDFDKVCFQKGLYKNIVYDNKGDLVTIGFYETRSGSEGAYTYSNPVVEETRTYQRSLISGLGTSSTSVIRYYCEDPDYFWDSPNYIKYYTSDQGYSLNQASRTVLINRAAMWLYADLLAEFGYPSGDQKAKEFSKDMGAYKSEYIASDRNYLLDMIQNSTRDYMTDTRKNILNSILNISYS